MLKFATAGVILAATTKRLKQLQQEEPITKIKLPSQTPFGTLLACGVRRITMFKFHTYVIGFYASSEPYHQAETQALRLVPARSTNSKHLHTAFKKMLLQKLPEEETDIVKFVDGAFGGNQTVPQNSHITIVRQSNVLQVYKGTTDHVKVLEMQNQKLSQALFDAYIQDGLIPELKDLLDKKNNN